MMATKQRPALPIDMDEFIHGAGAKSPSVVVGDKRDLVIQSSEPDVIPMPAAAAAEIAAVVAEVDSLVNTPAPAVRPASPKKAKAEPVQAQTMPWDDANPKVKNFVQVRAPEPLTIKLKWIKENTLGISSVHDLILTTLEEMADQRIEAILKGRVGQSKS